MFIRISEQLYLAIEDISRVEFSQKGRHATVVMRRGDRLAIQGDGASVLRDVIEDATILQDGTPWTPHTRVSPATAAEPSSTDAA